MDTSKKANLLIIFCGIALNIIKTALMNTHECLQTTCKAANCQFSTTLIQLQLSIPQRY